MGSRLVAVSCLLWILATGLSAQSGASSTEAPAESDTAAARRAPRQAGSEPLSRPAGATAESALEAKMRKLRATNLPSKRRTSGQADSQPTTRPAEPANRSATSRPAGAPTTRPAGGSTTQPARDAKAKNAGGESAEAVAKLKKSVALREIPDLQALADALYLAGRPKAAGALYERVVKDSQDNKNDKSQKRQKSKRARAWALYQLGNCHKSSDPDKAAEYFRLVQTKHGKSDWSAPAKAQADLIQWHQKKKPAELIRQSVAKPKAS